MADDIYRFSVLKKIDPFILAGMSMGGAIAIQFAINFPDKIKSLILMNTGPGTLFSMCFFIMSPILSFFSQKRVVLKAFFKSVLMNPLPRDELSVFVDDAALVRKDIWLQYLHPSNKVHDLRRLESLAIPTLVIIGEKDKTIPVEFQKNIADLIPKAVKIVMSN